METSHEAPSPINLSGAAQSQIQTPAPAVANNNLKLGLVLYFSFDKNEPGGKITDQSGHRNDGLAANVQFVNDGHQGGAAMFGLTGSYIRVPNNDSLNPSNLTLAAWIKTSNQEDTWRRVFDKSYTDGYALSIGGGHTPGNKYQNRARVEIGTKANNNKGATAGDGLVTDGRWHHLAATYNGAELILYVDGVPQQRVARWEGRVPANSHDLTLGMNLVDPNPKFNEVGASFDGLMDDPMIFNRALSADEVQALFESQGGVLAPKPAQPTPPAGIQGKPSAGMALIPASSFTMGDTLDGEKDAIPVNVTVRAFYMDVNLVSYSQWLSVYNWATSHGYEFDHAGAGKAANHPVLRVNWYDCVKWCNARSQQAGLTPVYYMDAGLTKVCTSGEMTPYVNWTANGYRLPTEAEWEKAARGGLSGQRFPWGGTINWSRANYKADPARLFYDLAPTSGYDPAFTDGGVPHTSPVGSFAANGYGLYDMAGNVFEWCWDWYGTPYAGGTDPHGPGTGSVRVLRGGNWGLNANASRSALHYSNNPSLANNFIGFRCVRGL